MLGLKLIYVSKRGPRNCKLTVIQCSLVVCFLQRAQKRNEVFCELMIWPKFNSLRPSDQTIIGSDNGLSPGRRQAIIWTNAGILLTGTLGTNFREILIEIRIFSFKKMGLKVSSAKWRPFCLGLNVLSFPFLVFCSICYNGPWYIDMLWYYRNSGTKKQANFTCTRLKLQHVLSNWL